MSNRIANETETWFKSCIDDGDFVLAEVDAPFFVIGSPSRGGRMLYATKSAPLLAWSDALIRGEMGIVSRYGLPTDHDIQLLNDVTREQTLYFLGDMDPQDLMIYAWLRERIQPRAFFYLGISDNLLATHRIDIRESFKMQLSPSEQRSLPVLRSAFPDFAEVVGAGCAGVLENGRKIELEAVVSAGGSLAAFLTDTLA